MRFKIEIELKDDQLPLDYRPIIMSLFKSSLTKYEDGRHFNEYYEIGKDKSFTFSVDIPKGKFTKEMIKIENRKIYILFSTGDVGTGIIFFNALMMQKSKKYPLANKNEMTIKKVLIEKEVPITTETINVTFKSPLCVRSHIKDTNKDIYYSIEKEGFDKALNNVLEFQINNSKSLSTSILENFSIKPIKCKKTVVRHHKQFLEVTIGQFQLSGNIALLNYLYTNGIASRKSSGFGLFEIIGGDML